MMEVSPRPWLFPHREAAAGCRLRLVCVPYAGGSAASYRTWTQLLPHGVAHYALELPGHGSRFSERACTNMDQLLDGLSSSLVPFLGSADCALFGHSLGAAIAFELAKRLEHAGLRSLRGVVVSGQRAFHRPPPRPPLHGLCDSKFLAEVIRYGGTPPGLFDDPELRELFLPILRADFELGETYAFDAGYALSCPLFAYGGLQDEDVSPDDIKAWSQYTSSEFRFRLFPGNHFFLHQHDSLVVSSLLQDLGISDLGSAEM